MRHKSSQVFEYNYEEVQTTIDSATAALDNYAVDIQKYKDKLKEFGASCDMFEGIENQYETGEFALYFKYSILSTI
jgi:hypothetical protein